MEQVSAVPLAIYSIYKFLTYCFLSLSFITLGNVCYRRWDASAEGKLQQFFRHHQGVLRHHESTSLLSTSGSSSFGLDRMYLLTWVHHRSSSMLSAFAILLPVRHLFWVLNMLLFRSLHSLEALHI